MCLIGICRRGSASISLSESTNTATVNTAGSGKSLTGIAAVTSSRLKSGKRNEKSTVVRRKADMVMAGGTKKKNTDGLPK
jgi:hypothetical protein